MTTYLSFSSRQNYLLFASSLFICIHQPKEESVIANTRAKTPNIATAISK